MDDLIYANINRPYSWLIAAYFWEIGFAVRCIETIPVREALPTIATQDE
jgi:hypothetical protein